MAFFRDQHKDTQPVKMNCTSLKGLLGKLVPHSGEVIWLNKHGNHREIVVL